jgi:hypothetical protein
MKLILVRNLLCKHFVIRNIILFVTLGRYSKRDNIGHIAPSVVRMRQSWNLTPDSKEGYLVLLYTTRCVTQRTDVVFLPFGEKDVIHIANAQKFLKARICCLDEPIPFEDIVPYVSSIVNHLS